MHSWEGHKPVTLGRGAGVVSSPSAPPLLLETPHPGEALATVAVSNKEAEETPGRQIDRPPAPRPREAWRSPPHCLCGLGPRVLYTKAREASCLFSRGQGNAFLAPSVSRQGRGCLDGQL